MKRLLSFVLSLALALSLVPSVFAASTEAVEAANALYEQGLFNGTGKDANGNPNFDLDRAPTRHEAVTMLVRLLGKANEAESGTWNTPFTDVADWAKPYVGYAYMNGLVNGTSSTTFSGNEPVSASQYLTLVLRALGYTSGTDFQWDKAWELSNKIGLTNGQYNADTADFTRGDVAIISFSALQFSVLPPQASANNIPEDELLDICKYYAAIKDSTDALVTLSNTVAYAHNGLTADEINTKVRTACMFAEVTIAGWERIYSLCGEYSDTSTLKEYARQIIAAYQYLPSNIDYLSSSFDECLNYLVEYINVLDANQGMYNMFWNELLPMVEPYIESSSS